MGGEGEKGEGREGGEGRRRGREEERTGKGRDPKCAPNFEILATPLIHCVISLNLVMLSNR